MKKAKPFVKWAGGKTQLLTEIEKLLPSRLLTSQDLTYVEPFVGGGAVLFWMLQKYENIKQAIINDINNDLINVYKVIKSEPEKLIALLSEMEKKYIACSDEDRKRYFLYQRERFNLDKSDVIKNSACFIFLNKTCFNGLYRVNKQGLFNVPHGRYKNPNICDEENIYACHDILQKVEILQGDFEQTLRYANANTFFYLDPPYKPLNDTSSFTSYTKEDFDDDDQIRLKLFCDDISKKGSFFILSNSDVNTEQYKNAFFDDLYSLYDIYRVKATRMINSKASYRGYLTELMISNSVERGLNYKYYGK